MELETIITLLNAGYTKEEIAALSANPAEKPAQTSQADTEQEKEPEKEPDQPKTEDTDKLRELQANVNNLQAALDKLTNAIVQKNINMTTAETMQQESISDILAKVIAPPKKEK